MLSTAALSVAIAGTVIGYPDQIDILRGADTTPQINLVLDTSCSMGFTGAGEWEISNCSHYIATRSANFINSQTISSVTYLTRIDQLKAALTGCHDAADGILDAWSQRVMFAVSQFGSDGFTARTGLVTGGAFDPNFANLSALETAVFSLPASGGTPMATAYHQAGLYFDSFFNNTNTEQCRQNYIVLMTDGVGNGDPATFNHISGQTNLTVEDASTCFGNAGQPGCPAVGAEPNYLDQAAEYLFSDSGGDEVDALSNVTGTQPIRTYTISFSAPEPAQDLLTAMAGAGDGLDYTATNYDQLAGAFEEIITSIVARSNVNFNSSSVQNDGLFSGNYAYATTYRPNDEGFWFSTTKKYCIFPSSPTDEDCWFAYDVDGETLLNNPQAEDIWTGDRFAEATSGGSGQVMFDQVYGVSNDAQSPPPASPLLRRNIYTWRPGGNDYVRVDGTNLTVDDTWSNSLCDHFSLLNKLHGYTHEVLDCSAGLYDPVQFDSWPQADTVNGSTLLLKYTDSCGTGGSNCYVVNVANDGMLHVFNAYNGVETSAYIPAQFWRPNRVAHHQLAQVMEQPTLEATRRCYFDGAVRLHHRDDNANGIIDAGETAQLIAALGRGGRGYIMWDVSSFNGSFNGTDNPPRPLFVDESTGFQHLRDTWSAPWIGDFRDPFGVKRPVAVFPTGHQPELDAPAAPFAALTAALAPATSDSEASPFSTSCAALGIPTEFCALPRPADICVAMGIPCGSGACSPCNSANPAACVLSGHAPPYCYDWPGLSAALVAAGLPQYTAFINAGSGFDIPIGPYSYSSGGRSGIAYRINFSNFDLQPNDYIAFYDSSGNEVGRISGSHPGAVSSPWIYDTAFRARLRTNGTNDAVAEGYTISGIDVIRTPAAPAAGSYSRPGIYVVDLDRWNGGSAQTPPFTSPSSDVRLFSDVPAAGDDRQAGALLARITSLCDGTIGAQEQCIDQNTNANTTDLRYMVCPISAEPSVYTEGDVLRRIYVGDECGQIWSIESDASNAWSVRRLLQTNNSSAGFPVAGRQSKDYRKIFTKLDIVLSTCPGARAVGVYFGTGNFQRPAMFDNMEDSTVTSLGAASVFASQRDVMGVVWDTPALLPNAALADLGNVTQVDEITNPQAGVFRNGFFMELRRNEKIMRPPLVFDGVANFKTYRPTVAATECISAEGQSRVFSFDNCTAAAVVDTNNDGSRTRGERMIDQIDDSDIGGGFMLLARRGGDAVVALPNEAPGLRTLPNKGNRRATRLLMWRSVLD